MLVVLSATLMLVDLFVAVMKVTVSVAIMQLEVSATLTPVTISAVNMWGTIFIDIMQVGVSVAVMQVVFSTVNYAHDYFYCNYAHGSFRCSHVCDSCKQHIYIHFSNWHPFFIKLTRKMKSIISSLHFTTLINILPKLRYFVGRSYIQIGHSVHLFFRQVYKMWGHLGFLKRGNLRIVGLAYKRWSGGGV